VLALSAGGKSRVSPGQCSASRESCASGSSFLESTNAMRMSAKYNAIITKEMSRNRVEKRTRHGHESWVEYRPQHYDITVREGKCVRNTVGINRYVSVSAVVLLL
jgi:hypothetical protein